MCLKVSFSFLPFSQIVVGIENNGDFFFLFSKYDQFLFIEICVCMSKLNFSGWKFAKEKRTYHYFFALVVDGVETWGQGRKLNGMSIEMWYIDEGTLIEIWDWEYPWIQKHCECPAVQELHGNWGRSAIYIPTIGCLYMKSEVKANLCWQWPRSSCEFECSNYY